MTDPASDLNLLLPLFYPKSHSIHSKLHPILDHIRATNIVSYHQIQDKALFSSQLQTLSNPQSPNPNLPINPPSYPNHHSIFDNAKTQFHFAKTQFHFAKTQFHFAKTSCLPSTTSQKHRNTFFSTIQTPDHARTPQRITNDYIQPRSKTSDKVKSKKHQSLTPGTADFTQNLQQLDLQKLNLFIKNPQSQLDFDDDLCNYIRLKMLTKNPYFSGGKFSKIKKHLVEQINLEQIQKKFFKSSAYNTKYKQFFERIIYRKRQNLSQIQNFNKANFNTLTPKKTQRAKNGQKDDKFGDKTMNEFNISKYSQAERQDSPLQNKGFSPERSKKMGFKAKLIFRKSPHDQNSELNQKQGFEALHNEELDIQVQGKAPSPSLQRYLQTRKKKFNVRQDLMKRSYRLDLQ